MLEKITAGEIADLKERFSSDVDRVLRVSFLEKLSTNVYKNVEIHRNGIRIQNAIFAEAIDLQNMDIPYEIWLTHCQFKSHVNFRYSTFRRNLIFDQSSFATADFKGIRVNQNILFQSGKFMGPVDFAHSEITGNFQASKAKFEGTAPAASFNGITVGRLAIFNDAEFAGSVDFAHADIRGQFMAQRIRFTNDQGHVIFQSMKVGDSLFSEQAVFAGTVDFTGLKVGRAALLRETVFTGPVDFSYAVIGSNFEAADIQFINSGTADFVRMKTQGSINIRKATFKGAANFMQVDIGADLNADEAQFTNTTQRVYFAGMRVGGHAYFRQKVLFAGPVDFLHADIAGYLAMDEAEFTNTHMVSFRDMKVGGQASFRKARFTGAVNFEHTDIGSFLEARETQFQNAHFQYMKIGRSALFRKATFAGAVNFSQVSINGDFNANEAEFRKPNADLDFSDMNVAGTTSFEGVAVAGQILLAKVRVRDLLIRGSQRAPLLFSRLDISQAVITGELRLEDLHLSSLIAESTRVGGPAILNRVRVDHEVNLERSNLLMLIFTEVS